MIFIFQKVIWPKIEVKIRFQGFWDLLEIQEELRKSKVDEDSVKKSNIP